MIVCAKLASVWWFRNPKFFGPWALPFPGSGHFFASGHLEHSTSHLCFKEQRQMWQISGLLTFWWTKQPQRWWPEASAWILLRTPKRQVCGPHPFCVNPVWCLLFTFPWGYLLWGKLFGSFESFFTCSVEAGSAAIRQQGTRASSHSRASECKDLSALIKLSDQCMPVHILNANSWNFPAQNHSSNVSDMSRRNSAIIVKYLYS